VLFVNFIKTLCQTVEQLNLLAQKPWIVPIPGTTKLHCLRENSGAAAVLLAPEDLRAMASAASKIPVQGARYPEHLQKLVGR
jgi:hypothetical protein